MRFSDKNLSIVIQGSIDQRFTQRVIESARIFFPRSEIIISTWKNSYSDCLCGHNIIVESDDPGKNIVGGEGIRNLNRHITSTYNGILQCSRDVVIKIRSDTIFLHGDCIHYFDLWDKRCDQYRLFDKRILVTNLYTLRSNDQPCYISDFFYCGLREDMLKLFNLPHLINRDTDFGYGPEQYIATGYFHKKHGNRIINEEESDIIIGNNYSVLDGQRQAGILCMKYPQYQDNWHHTMMRHFEWQMLYYKLFKGQSPQGVRV